MVPHDCHRVITELTIDPTSVRGGDSARATAKLYCPAAAPGDTFKVWSSDPNAMPPTTVDVPAGAQEFSFWIRTGQVFSEKEARITIQGYDTVSATLTIKSP